MDIVAGVGFGLAAALVLVFLRMIDDQARVIRKLRSLNGVLRDLTHEYSSELVHLRAENDRLKREIERWFGDESTRPVRKPKNPI